MDTDYYTVDIDTISTIDNIEFDVLSNEEIKRMSALGDGAGISIPDLHDNSEPKKGGLIDSRLGTSGNDINCTTCGLNTTYCVGHFGHIDLADVVFHIGYLPFIQKIMTCICPRCSKILLYKNEEEVKELLKIKNGKERMTFIRESSKNITYCQKEYYGCGAPIPRIKIEIKKTSGAINIIAETDGEVISGEGGVENKKKLRQILTPDIVYDILKNISDEDCLILGMDPKRSRPEYMIHKVFPVPPVQVRPSARGDFMGGTTIEDDLTHKLADIVKSNLRIIKNKENSEINSKYNPDHQHLLQFHIATYFENDSAYTLKSEQKGKPFKSIASRLKTKEGRVRGNLMGKRGDFTARTVITSDPTIGNNQLGVPVKIAMTLTFPEVVTPHNIEYLTKLVKNGRDNYPGANFVFPISSRKPGARLLSFDLRYIKEKIELRFGDVVERHLIDGDIVLLNRQPTLHKQSMMGHRIKIINDPTLQTFRLSVAITTPYNADFDGDEMNIFLCQSIQTNIELEELAAVERQIITPTTSQTIVGIVQDGLLGAYNLTSPTIRIDWRNAMNIMSYTTLDDFSYIKKKKNYSGSELYSLILPPGITVNKPNLKIKNSILVEGQLTKQILGSKKKNNLIQLIWDGYGVNTTRDFIDNTQKLVNNFNLYNGFSAGIGYTFIPDNVKKQINGIFDTKNLKIAYMITENENNPDLMPVDSFERKLFSEMNIIRDDASKLVIENIQPDNAFGIMMRSGSKGDATNMGQMIGCVGLQAFEGKLMPKKYMGRSLAYFHKGDDRADSRGLVKSSFISGLEFPEFVFHLMASRLGIIEQAIKTADTGYAQRRLVKSLEDIMVKYDGTVRTCNESIIQLVYGDSGTDTTKQYEYKINLLEMNNSEVASKFKFTSSELKQYDDFNEKDNDELYDMIINMRNSVRKLIMCAKMDYKVITNTFMLPVNLTRIIDTINGRVDSKKSKLSPKYILDKLNYILLNENTTLMFVNKKNKNSWKIKDEIVHKTIFKISLFDAISPKRIITDYMMSKEQFDEACEQIIDNFNKNIAEPGDMIGIIAAQSTGEPLTQMTLNSFHHSGIASMSATTQGVPRIKELLSVSKNQKTPQMVVYLTEEFRQSKDMSNKIASYIKHTTLGEIRGKITVLYDPLPSADKGIMLEDGVSNTFYKNKSSKYGCQSDITGMPWLIRIEIDREKMLEKELNLLEITSKFCNWWDKRNADTKILKKEEKKIITKITQLGVLCNTDSDKQPIIHIRFNVKDTEKDKFDLSTINSFIELIIDKFKLKGINSISNIPAIPKELVISYDNEGNVVKNEHYVIYAAGVNLEDIRYLIGIDLNKTVSNDIVQMYNTFGIEVARAILLREISIAYERGGANDLNYQHISLIVDQMTHNGVLNSIDRHGMSKTDTEPLGRASFEKTVDQLLNAAVHGEIDHMKGVSARIMAGQVIKGGTGYCDISLDTEMIEKSEYVEDMDFGKTFVELNTTQLANDIIKKQNNDIFMPI
jgi:DNA-directed RNA polymerase II subunit RPB1